MSSLKDFVVERAKDSEEVYKKVRTHSEWELFQLMCTNTMRLSSFDNIFIEPVLTVAKADEQKRKKLEK